MTNKNRNPIIAVAGVSLAFSIAFTGMVGCNQQPAGGAETTTLASMGSDVVTDPFGSTVTPESSDPAGTTGTTAPEETTTEPAPQFVEVNEVVYVTFKRPENKVNIRKGPGKQYDAVGEAKDGTKFTRVKYSSTWSAILIDGVEYYVSSDCLTTKAPLEFNPYDGTVYVATENANLRSKPDLEYSEIDAVAVRNQALVAIGVSVDGKWYKISYEKNTGDRVYLYISASVVTTKQAGGEQPDDGFTSLSKQIKITAESLYVRSAPSSDNKETIVGTALKDQVFTVVAVSPDGSWYRIKFTPENGTEGEYYISASSNYVVDVTAS